MMRHANGAVSVSAPKKVSIKPGKGRDTTFRVTFTIDGAALEGNFMNSGSNGANPEALTTNEFDGYLILDDGTSFHLPNQGPAGYYAAEATVLPRAEVPRRG